MSHSQTTWSLSTGLLDPFPKQKSAGGEPFVDSLYEKPPRDRIKDWSEWVASSPKGGQWQSQARTKNAQNCAHCSSCCMAGWGRQLGNFSLGHCYRKNPKGSQSGELVLPQLERGFLGFPPSLPSCVAAGQRPAPGGCSCPWPTGTRPPAMPGAWGRRRRGSARPGARRGT